MRPLSQIADNIIRNCNKKIKGGNKKAKNTGDKKASIRKNLYSILFVFFFHQHIFRIFYKHTLLGGNNLYLLIQRVPIP